MSYAKTCLHILTPRKRNIIEDGLVGVEMGTCAICVVFHGGFVRLLDYKMSTRHVRLGFFRFNVRSYHVRRSCEPSAVGPVSQAFRCSIDNLSSYELLAFFIVSRLFIVCRFCFLFTVLVVVVLSGSFIRPRPTSFLMIFITSSPCPRTSPAVQRLTRC